ncbi:hypothetical protein BSPWISOXPB_9990 [uncultured Gammaproteobacteria bacterium]|nr:hypothetical protein BSPWISOXPB_9990 [uncultured Gammaproteobacteria bacterium]
MDLDKSFSLASLPDELTPNKKFKLTNGGKKENKRAWNSKNAKEKDV